MNVKIFDNFTTNNNIQKVFDLQFWTPVATLVYFNISPSDFTIQVKLAQLGGSWQIVLQAYVNSFVMIEGCELIFPCAVVVNYNTVEPPAAAAAAAAAVVVVVVVVVVVAVVVVVVVFLSL